MVRAKQYETVLMLGRKNRGLLFFPDAVYKSFGATAKTNLCTNFEVFSFVGFADIFYILYRSSDLGQAHSWRNFSVILFKFTYIEQCAKYQVSSPVKCGLCTNIAVTLNNALDYRANGLLSDYIGWTNGLMDYRIIGLTD